uniref:Interleukin 20 receptor subunit beta n=1 Tax=Apteryx owenii TaxID=8824 RepID=A0A8B9PCT3_APTOW
CIHEDALLSAPQNISIISTNMKHFLTWSPVTIQGETVRYSVEFQGEYEREYANESWIPICECSLITATVCNITEDISATVSYNLRVRADIGTRRSEWGTLKGFFNRITTYLTPPLMKIIADGYHLLVELEDMGPAFQFCVLYWKKGQESRVKKQIRTGSISSTLHLDTMEAGTDYCVKAQTYVEAINRSSNFSQMQCVRAQGNSQLSFLFPQCRHTQAGHPSSSALFFLLPPNVSCLVCNKIFQYSCCPIVVLPDTLVIFLICLLLLGGWVLSTRSLGSCGRQDRRNSSGGQVEERQTSLPV